MSKDCWKTAIVCLVNEKTGMIPCCECFVLVPQRLIFPHLPPFHLAQAVRGCNKGVLDQVEVLRVTGFRFQPVVYGRSGLENANWEKHDMII